MGTLNHYIVKLRCHIGGYEKIITHCVEGKTETHACRIACEDECHNDPHFTSADYDECEDDDMLYRVDHIKLITREEAEIYHKITGWN